MHTETTQRGGHVCFQLFVLKATQYELGFQIVQGNSGLSYMNVSSCVSVCNRSVRQTIRLQTTC